MDRVDRKFSGIIAVAFALAGTALMVWGALIFCAQCLAWLKFGFWQPVPAYAALLSAADQSFQLIPIALWEATWSPLELVPSAQTGHHSLEEVSAALGGSMLGFVRVIQFLLSAPLSFISFLAGSALFSLTACRAD